MFSLSSEGEYRCQDVLTTVSHPSGFLLLPKEIRDLTYNFCGLSSASVSAWAINRTNLHLFSDSRCYRRGGMSHNRLCHRCISSPLLLVNKQIYREIMDLIYANWCLVYTRPEVLLEMTMVRPIARSHVKKLTLVVTDSLADWTVALDCINFANLRSLCLWNNHPRDRTIRPAFWHAIRSLMGRLPVTRFHEPCLKLVNADMSDDQRDEVPPLWRVIEDCSEKAEASRSSSMSLY